MVNRIGQGGSLAREAILAALKSQAKAADNVRQAASEIGAADPDVALPGTQPTGAGAQVTSFDEQLQAGLTSVNAEMGRAEALAADLVTGKVSDFTAVAVQMKKAELSFRYTMEIRNKLIDAYREVMRMNV